MASDNKIIAKPAEGIETTIEHHAMMLYGEEPCARKTWNQLAERTRNRYRRCGCCLKPEGSQ